ncbi:dihydroorotate dehydrogenase electron transfer subunit [Christensenellaceae bacterium OttesenSCG-928-K19]|nr:dihydroorotate dehydrogenase electron transfer subunit [Christensenellaceae bacterium OttesenSCG-928-K19]
MKKHYSEKVLSNELIAQNTYLLKITCEDEFLKWFRPGQFVHIQIPAANELLLRRPISINYVDYEKRQVHIAYYVVGKGTRLLSQVRPGDILDVLMPLGNGFSITSSMQKIWLVGGGIGNAPLKSMFSKYMDREYKAFLGFRCEDAVYQEADFCEYAATCVTTDDGSYGGCGFCTDVLKEELAKDTPDVILACGPMPLFKTLASIVGDIPTQVSMEQHMGCGTGGCATCVCGIGGENKRVCLEGPVFDIKEVDALYG